MDPKLSVVTVAYYSQDVLGGFLESVRTAAPDAEVIIVNNAPSDTGVDRYAANDRVQVITANGNIGFGRGCNLGVASARGEWLLLVNPDVRVSEIALPARATGPFGIGAAQLDDGTGHYLSGCRPEPSIIEDWHHEVFRRFLPRRVSSVVTGRSRTAGWAYGALALLRVDEFRDLGGFDDRYFLYQEDRDLGARYRMRGMPVHDIPSVTGRHRKGQSVRDADSLAAEAWAFVSWIEYLHIWRGPGVASRTAYRALTMLRGMGAACAMAGKGNARARRKAHAAEILERYIMEFESRLPLEAAACYPGARAIIRAVR